MVPVVPALVFATYKSPFVELSEALLEVSESNPPVVKALPVIVNPVWVVAVLQFHVWAKLVLSNAPVAVAATSVFMATPIEAVEPICSIVAQDWRFPASPANVLAAPDVFSSLTVTFVVGV